MLRKNQQFRLCRVSVKCKLEADIDDYHEWAVAIVRKQDRDGLGVSEQEYKEYTQSVSAIDKASEILITGKKYVKHEFLTAEDLMTILKATDELVDNLLTE